MGIYSGFNYGTGVKYGYESRIEFSVNPFTATSLDYDQVYLSWGNPAGTILGLRVVRNHIGYSETEEDGVILLDKYTFSTQVTSLYDVGATSTLIPGSYAYYTVWLMLGDYSWIPAGWTYALIPTEHSTVTDDGVLIRSSQDKFADLLPKVFLTKSQSYVDELDTTSDLYNFIGGFSFTVDEILTYADLLTPSLSGETINPESLGVKSYQYGVLAESDIGMQRQKRLLREATYLYSYKGTSDGISTLAESITNYAPTITLSPNIMLSNQDSTFRGGLGNWKAANGVLSLESSSPLYYLSGYPSPSFEKTFSAKFVTTDTTATLSLGTTEVLTTAIPVTPGTSYNLSWYAKGELDYESTITSTVKWYDYRGALIGSYTDATPMSVTSGSGPHVVADMVAPGKTFTVLSYELVAGAVTLTIDPGAGHGLSASDIVIVAGIPASDSSTALQVSINGQFTLTAVTSTTLTYDFVGSGVISSTTVTSGTASSTQAAFAGIELLFTNGVILNETYYIDLIQFADSAADNVGVYNEARAVEIYLAPSKTNYLLNPSFEIDYTHWDVNEVTATVIPDSTLKEVPHGTSSLELITTADTTSSAPTLSTSVVGAISTGQFITFSCYAKIASGTLSTMNLRLTATDSGTTTSVYNEVALDSGTAVSSRPSLSTTWQKIEVNLFVPSSLATSTTTLTAALYGGTDSATLYIEAAQLETGYKSTDYFDGSLAFRGASWTGTAHDSSSIVYVNKGPRISRLIQEIEKYIPLNTPYKITTGPVANKVVETYGYSS